MNRPSLFLWVGILSLWLAAAGGARAGVRVVEDEVVFTLRAPDAESVFLVGDFNNWNPTVEPMEKEGDAFVVTLFLVVGTYRYKFVVDGEWIVDPDNPGDREKGSYLTLEERSGGYALSTDEPEPEAPVRPVRPSLRYIGQSRWDDGDSDTEHIADLFLDVERPHLLGRVDLQTTNRTWKGSPPSFDIDALRALVEARSGALVVAGFENDSTWTSRGPVTLVGKDGVFDYDAGFARHGVSTAWSPASFLLVRAIYADRTEGTPSAAPAIPAGAIAAFALGASSDTTAYSYRADAADADQAALEVAVDTPNFDAGYVHRHDRGLHAGVLADIRRAGSSLPTTVYATREERDVALYWARAGDFWGLGATLGYGRASSDIALVQRGEVDADSSSGVTADVAVDDADSQLRFLESDRVVVAVDGAALGASWRASWDFVSFDFDSRVYAKSSADVHRAGARVSRAWARWNAALETRFTDQHYGRTPAELHVGLPDRDVWLYGRDELGVGDIVAFADERTFCVRLAVGWSAPATLAPWAPCSLGVDAGAVTGGDGSAELVEARAAARFEYRGRFYALLDGRLAAYDKEDWGVDETFLSGWLEVGYRFAPVDVNLGWGFDPVVFDAVANDYQDIGRVRWLRQSIEALVRRDDAPAAGARLVARERELEATGTIKLECVLRF